MNRTYAMVDHAGVWWTAIQGHITDEAELADIEGSLESDGPLVVKHENFSFHPRIKWCDRLGWGCDNNGEWHAHWESAHPSVPRPWTLVRRDWTKREVAR